MSVEGAGGAPAGALLRRHIHALAGARFGPAHGMRRAFAGICGARPARSSRSREARTLEQLQSLAADDRLVDAMVPASQMLPGNARGLRGRCDGGAHPPRAQLSGVAIPLGSRLALREGADATGGPGGHRGSGAAESVPSGGGAVENRKAFLSLSQCPCGCAAAACGTGLGRVLHENLAFLRAQPRGVTDSAHHRS